MKEETKKELIHGIKEELGEEFEVFSELNKQKILAKVEYQVINAEKTGFVLGKCPMKNCLILLWFTECSYQKMRRISALRLPIVFVRRMGSAERNWLPQQKRTWKTGDFAYRQWRNC